MERSAIRGRLNDAPIPGFRCASSGLRIHATGDKSLLAITRNRLITRWTACGKPVDDCTEKPVHLPRGSLGQSSEKPGYVSVHNAGYKPCARSRQPVNNR